MSNTSRRVSIYINDKEAASSIKALRGEQKKLTREIESGKLSEEQYIAAFKRLDDITPILQAHKKNLGGIESTYDKMKAGVGKFAAVAGIAFGADMVIEYGKKLFNTSVQMDTLARKAVTVLGSSLGYVTAQAREHAEAMGLTNSQYVAAVTNVADLLKPMGFTTEEAAKQSVQIQNLSGALSEWSGGKFNAIETTESLRKALLGEREELERYGVSIKQSEVSARLAEQGFSKLTGQALKQAEAMATLQLITEKSADAIRSYETNSDSAARRQAELTAKITDISEKLAVALLPAFESLTAVAASLVDGLSDVTDFVVGMIDPAKSLTQAFDDQASKVEDLEKNINPLLDRYDELSQKTNPTAAEQKELESIITQVAEAIPGAVSAFDTYGKAMAINTDIARDLIAVERERLKFINQEAIGSLENQISQLETLRDRQLALRKSGGTASVSGSGLSGGFKPFSENELRDFDGQISRITNTLTGANAELDRLKGNNIKVPEKTAGGGGTGLDAEAEKEKRKKAAEDAAKERGKPAEREKKDQEELLKLQEQFNKKVEKLLADERFKRLEGATKIIEDVKREYKGYYDDITEIEARSGVKMSAERRKVDDIIQQETNERLKVYAKEQAEIKEAIRIEQLKKEKEQARADAIEKAEFEKQVDEELRAAKAAEEGETAEQNHILRLEQIATRNKEALDEEQKHYEELLKQAGGNKELIAQIEKAHKLRVKAISQQNHKDLLEENKKYFEEDLAETITYLQEFETALGAMNEAIKLAGLENTKFGKILAAAQITIAGAVATAKAVASAQDLPFPANLAAMAIAVATVASTILSAKKALKGAVVPQKKEGGWVDAIGADDGQSYQAKYIGQPTTGMLNHNHPVLVSTTGGPVLANERGPEFFVSNASLRNPVIANYARMIDNIQRGRYSQYATGGFTDSPTGTSSTLPSFSGSPTPSGGDAGTNAALLVAINRLNDNLENGIKAVTDDEFAVQNQIKFNKVNRVAGGTLG